MLRKIESKTMGRSNLGWLKSIFHFSFAEYYNPNNINFGVLRVINDDLVEAKTGFDTHPHKDMEIISYIVEGGLTHGDSMGNRRTITRGEVQYLSAGTGITHSEYNLTGTVARFLQIWIVPDEKGHKPQYGDHQFPWSDRVNKWLHMVSSFKGDAPIKVNQDVNLYVTQLEKGKKSNFVVGEGRQVYMVLIEGKADINGVEMFTRDAAEIVDETILIEAEEASHILIIEMNKIL